MSIKEQMESAKAYIADGQYDKARKILKKIEHPTAEKWLRQLNDKYPQKKSYGKMRAFNPLLRALFNVWIAFALLILFFTVLRLGTQSVVNDTFLNSFDDTILRLVALSGAWWLTLFLRRYFRQQLALSDKDKNNG